MISVFIVCAPVEQPLRVNLVYQIDFSRLTVAGNQKMLKTVMCLKICKADCLFQKTSNYRFYLLLTDASFFVHLELVTAPDNFNQSLSFIYLIYCYIFPYQVP